MEVSSMRSLGVLLIVLGAGSLILPLVGLQFRLLEPLDPYQPIAGMVVAVIGAVLFVLAQQRASAASADAAQAARDRPAGDTTTRPPG
jgi:drug/metabolite transporter (DMT)-like permease